MFENMNPLDRPTAFLEIGILIFIAFVLGFICASIKMKDVSVGDYVNNTLGRIKNGGKETTEKYSDRDIIVEPTGIRATKTRDRKGNLVTEDKEIDSTN